MRDYLWRTTHSSCQNFWFKILRVPPLSEPPPPPKMQIWTDLGTLGWVGLDPPLKMQIWTLWVELVCPPPPRENADLDRSWHFGLSWSRPVNTPPPPHPDNADLDRSWHFGFCWSDPPPPPGFRWARMWRLIAVSPMDTISLQLW